MKQLLYFSLLLLVSANISNAQSCKVSVDSLNGTYSGACLHGKAEGQGTATGIDSYTGNFHQGYPDGEGKYTWKNGNWYQGTFRRGIMEGEGTLSRAVQVNDKAVIMTGFWKKGKYIGQYEHPFIVHTFTNSVNNVSVRKMNGTDSYITLAVKNITGGASSLNEPQIAKVKLVSMEIMQGHFGQQLNDENSSTTTNRYTFRQVVYPFYAILTFERPMKGSFKAPVDKVGVEILESGNWNIEVDIDN
ncbi:MAG TPA: hypothetical protein VK666_29885 [Chryseolinea sp.]|nr:hypothetical protein [Chryseolinea sp.]